MYDQNFKKISIPQNTQFVEHEGSRHGQIFLMFAAQR